LAMVPKVNFLIFAAYTIYEHILINCIGLLQMLVKAF